MGFLEAILMTFNPFALRHIIMSVSLPTEAYYKIIAVIFLYHMITFKFRKSIINLVPIIFTFLGVSFMFILDTLNRFHNPRTFEHSGINRADEWRFVLYMAVFIAIYSVYSLIVVVVIDKIKKHVHKNRVDKNLPK